MSDTKRRYPHELVAFLVIHAVQYAREFGLDGLHPFHYDLMVKYGCRMTDFKRAKIEDGTKDGTATAVSRS